MYLKNARYTLSEKLQENVLVLMNLFLEKKSRKIFFHFLFCVFSNVHNNDQKVIKERY